MNKDQFLSRLWKQGLEAVPFNSARLGICIEKTQPSDPGRRKFHRWRINGNGLTLSQ